MIKALRPLEQGKRATADAAVTPAERDSTDPYEIIEVGVHKVKFTPAEFAVRNVLDEFFTDLSAFQHHIDARLLRLEDVRPYLDYWIKSITGHGKVHGALLSPHICRFLLDFDYRAVIRLAKSMDYSFEGTPVELQRLMVDVRPSAA